MTHQDAEIPPGRDPGAKASEARVPLVEVLKAALDAHRRGDLDAAESGYRAVLAARPDNADALQYLGVIAHARGDNDKAVRLLRKALRSDPRNGTVHNNLASIYVRNGQQELAERHYREALECPHPPEDALCNLGVLERMQGRLGHARMTLEAAVARHPSHHKAKRELAEAYILSHDFARAEPLLRAYMEAVPGDASARSRYGLVLQRLGRLDEAQDYVFAADATGRRAAEAHAVVHELLQEPPPEAAWQRLRDFIDSGPDETAAQIGIGGALVRLGHVTTGLRALEIVANRHPDTFEVWNDIGSTLSEMGRRQDGLRFLHLAAEIAPDKADIYNNLGNIYCDLGRTDDAIANLQRALALAPDHPEAHVALSRAYRDAGELDKAALFARATLSLPRYMPRHFPALAQAFRATCDFDGLEALGSIWDNCGQLNLAQLHSVFLSLLVHTRTEADARRLFGLVRAWAEPLEQLAARSPLPPLPAVRRAGPIRLGILSSDLRGHSVARFFMPLIEGHDRERVEIYCYTPYLAPGDPVQAQIRDASRKFTVLDGKTDREMAETIRADEIDILVELNGFTHGTCLRVVPYRPAPVQMTWIGYPFTVGLRDMDYMILDRFTKPADETMLSEEVVVMPDAWLCFRQFEDIAITAQPPFERNGVVTFGSLNNPYKITREVVAMWARAMAEVPESRFLFVRPEVKSLALVRNLVAEFGKHGIAPQRISIFDNKTQKQSHLNAYNEIDISLDTYPVTGGTTTCEALWMGVPVVALKGELQHQRISYAILAHCGLEELCVDDADGLVEVAAALARDPDRLRRWRAGLRDVMRASPLCDEARFVHQFQEMLDQVVALHGLR